jgi:HK97 gp10 family phage protein
MTSQLTDLDKLAGVMREGRERAIAAAGQALEEGAKLIQQKARERLTAGAQGGAELLPLRDSIVVEHQGLQAVIGTKDAAAKAREFGTADAPPRAFLGPAALECRDKIHAMIARAVSGALTGDDAK